MDKNFIITIGRENGSGGKYIGERLAQDYGIKCYDNELISEISKKTGIDEKNVEKYDEMPPNSVLYFGGQPIPSKLFEEQSKLIKEIAEKESCIFIGRVSDYVLRDFPNVINIFIHAPLGARIERYCRRNNVSIQEATKQISRKDKARASYYQYYTNQIWGEAKNYNLSIDTSKTGIDGSISLIKEFINLTVNRENKII